LIERGIGEVRAALIEQGEIIEARIELDGVRQAGSVIVARLVDTGISGRNAVAVGEGGTEYLLPRGAPGVTEGAVLNIAVTRAARPKQRRRSVVSTSAGRSASTCRPLERKRGRQRPRPSTKLCRSRSSARR